VARLFLVRHGETAQQSSIRYWGRTDVKLSETGLWQAARLRDRLASEKIEFAFSSCLERAFVTASTVAEPHGLEVVQDSDLNEIDFGDAEGLRYHEINSRFPSVAQMWNTRDPGLQYPNGESLPQMETRVTAFKKRLDCFAEDDTVLVVAHSGILRTLVCQLLEIDTNLRWKLRVDLASLTVINTYPNTAIMSLLNDTSHFPHP